MNNSILQINASGRFDGSVTRKISEQVIKQMIHEQPELTISQRELADGLPFLNEKWIESTFTPPEVRDETHTDALAYSDELVNEVMEADHIVMAVPIYNFSVPAVLKAWIDLIARVHLTFKYTDSGPVGLLKDKKATLIFASGGVPIGSPMDFASPYLKHVLGFIGITDITIIDANSFAQ